MEGSKIGQTEDVMELANTEEKAREPFSMKNQLECCILACKQAKEKSQRALDSVEALYEMLVIKKNENPTESESVLVKNETAESPNAQKRLISMREYREMNKPQAWFEGKRLFKPFQVLTSQEKEIVQVNTKKLPDELKEQINILEKTSTWFISDDNGTYSRGSCLEGAPADQVSALYEQGLLVYLYPGEDLKEMEQLPTTIQDAAKSFIKGTGIKRIFLRFYSVIPEWDEETGRDIDSSHIVWIGVISENYSRPLVSQIRQWNPEEVTRNIAVRRARNFLGQIETLETALKKNVWIYKSTSKNFVIANSRKPTSGTSSLMILDKLRLIKENEVEALEETHRRLCGMLRDDDPTHKCKYCPESPVSEDGLSDTMGDEGMHNLYHCGPEE